MAVLKYVTRGEQTVQGKQKAYFCAHPDDYARYFEKISNEILDTLVKENNRNCAFFYLEDANAERDDEFKFSFKEMNLIVMPVTTRLLTTSNPALDIEFKLAAEYGIPVLPLMMESGLEGVFNAKCGDIQFLNPNPRDVTAISYEEKLTKYLTSVLIGDELAEKIRKAFDAYIFLSYRKKDRQYAQELMHLIHKNEFCRDIAIWYDEFLTPGENFNKSIEEALKKSKLFALAVTPNLVNEENYIMKVEYPMAKKADKLILPAELVETDRSALSEKYEDIPSCVSAKDEPALTLSLKHALEGIALRKNDNDPDHNFFIGLAYLGGVDVEKDNERAIKLITSSAEAGLLEAMEKLVSIYRNGEIGVRDYEKAIEWQRKLVEYRRVQYENDRSARSSWEYLHALWLLGNHAYELRRIEESEVAYTEMLSSSKAITQKSKLERAHIRKLYEMGFLADHEIKNETDKIQHLISYLPSSYDNLGEIYMFRGDLDKAEECFKASLQIRYDEAADFEDDVYSLAPSASLRYLGDVSTARGDYCEAEKYYFAALSLTEKYYSREGAFASINFLLLLKERLGDTYLSRGDNRKALECYIESHSLAQEDAKQNRNDESLRNLATSYGRLANVFRLLGDTEGAEKNYRISLELRIKLENETGMLIDKSYLALGYDRLGHVLLCQGDLDAAEEYYRKALVIREQLADGAEILHTLRDLSESYLNIGNIMQSRGDIEGAEKYYLKSFDIREKLFDETSLLQSRRDLSKICYKLGDVYGILGERDKAVKYYIKSTCIAEALVSETGTIEDMDNLADLYESLATVFVDKRSEYVKNALEIRFRIVAKVPDNIGLCEKLDELKRRNGVN